MNVCRGSASCAGRTDGDEDGAPEARPPWLSGNVGANADRLDVRPMLAAHEEPFAAVMAAAKTVPVDSVLVIDAPFNPAPLRRVLERKDYQTYGERIEAGHWRIWCRRAAAVSRGQADAGGAPAQGRIWRDGAAVHIDVRGLDAPAPLTAVLALIDGGAHEGVVIVHIHRDPIYLYPELAERGWSAAPLPSPPGDVCLELNQELRAGREQ
jgi:Uncharacterized conserved protein (DUF2249)